MKCKDSCALDIDYKTMPLIFLSSQKSKSLTELLYIDLTFFYRGRGGTFKLQIISLGAGVVPFNLTYPM